MYPLIFLFFNKNKTTIRLNIEDIEMINSTVQFLSEKQRNRAFQH